MAIENLEGVRKWLDRHCAEPAEIKGEERAPARYVRLKAGRARRSADVVWRETATGADARKLAEAVLDRHSRLSKGERGWLEALEVGGRSVVDTLPLGEADMADDGPSPMEEIDLSAGPLAVVGPVLAAMTATNEQYASMLRSKDEQLAETQRSFADKIVEVMGRYAEMSGRALGSESLLTFIQDNRLLASQGEDSGMGEALEALAPHIPAALALLASRKGGKGKAETPEERADRVLAEVEELWREHPDLVMEPARLMRMGAIGEAIQARLAELMGQGQPEPEPEPEPEQGEGA